MPKPVKNKRLTLVYSGLAVVAGAALVWVGGYLCPCRLLTGIPCPGCGMTHALKEVLRLDLTKAWNYHPMIFAIIPLVVYLAGLWGWRRKLPSLREPWVWWPVMIVAILILMVWCVRLVIWNMVGFPTEW